MSPSAETNGTIPSRKLDVLIVGAGFGGLYQLYVMRKQGYNCKLSLIMLPRIWYWNCYPGARVDSHAPLYGYSIEGLYKDWTWTERFPGGEELRQYFDYVDKRLDLSKDIELNTSVDAAEFDTNASVWRVTLSTGEVIECKYFVLGTGFAAKNYVPDFKGMERFKGIMHHTYLKGKKVAVIGTGASGVQTIQEIGPEVGHLTVLQRTPNLCIPMRQRKLDPVVEAELKNQGEYEKIFKTRGGTFTGFEFEWIYINAADATEAEVRETYERLWEMGGFNFWVGTYQDVLYNQEVNDGAYKFWAEKHRARINDPRKRDLLAPLLENQPHAWGIKRPCLEQRYYEVYNQENVDLISVKENPIDTFTEKGILMSDGQELEFDVILLATGFDTQTGGLVQIDIKGADGITLKDKWAKGAWTNLGMTTNGFPNMFILYGLQGKPYIPLTPLSFVVVIDAITAPTAFANGPTLVEVQGDWISDAINYCEKNNKKTMDSTALSEARWTKIVDDMWNTSLFRFTQGWYNGSNIPGKTKQALNYTGGVNKYMAEARRIAEAGYEGYVFDKLYV
ncbi:hypothetical protein HYALB_00005191 [Hymenoscyphus albidus]|uniref:FAD/NAD(P)-binding domain-containing protein n=1 Tax=Hymenoscyphus albidus TaxID=595503 RepID=A0A9N9LWX8_9HELO|nr:hypothetical protein HYALB_00005191 [Hymenoscyphus albidus]